MRHSTYIPSILLILFLGSSAASQPRGRSPEEAPGFLFYDAVNLIGPDSARSRVDVQYRIDDQFFVLVKNPDPSFPYAFRRRGEILVELIDSAGTSRARTIDEAVIGASQTEEMPEARGWYQGCASLTVPPGLYTIILEITDLESDRHFLDQSRKILAQNFTDRTFGTATPLIVADSGAGSPPPRLVLQNLGGDVLFGSSEALFLEMIAPGSADTAATVSYTFAERSRSSDLQPAAFSDTIRGLNVIRGFDLAPARSDGNVGYLVAPGGSADIRGLFIPLHTERLPLRDFLLTVSVRLGSHEKHFSQPARMVWPDMPRSLRNIDYAIDALRYIATPEQLDSLKQGSREDRMNNLEAFWRRRDPHPATAFNEVMTQYYRRVDHASRQFGTLHDPDGSKTDRGKIYILFGQPTTTRRTLDPEAGYKEVWVYEKLNKEFTFVDTSKSGNYVLLPSSPR